MVVDPLMADPDRLGRSQPATDLFRTPLLVPQSLDQLPGFHRNPAASFALLTSDGEAMALLRAVPSQSLIPLHFATNANGGLVNTDHASDLRGAVPHFQGFGRSPRVERILSHYLRSECGAAAAGASTT